MLYFQNELAESESKSVQKSKSQDSNNFNILEEQLKVVQSQNQALLTAQRQQANLLQSSPTPTLDKITEISSELSKEMNKLLNEQLTKFLVNTESLLTKTIKDNVGNHDSKHEMEYRKKLDEVFAKIMNFSTITQTDSKGSETRLSGTFNYLILVYITNYL